MNYKILRMTESAQQVINPTFEVLNGNVILYSGKSIKKAKEIADKNKRKVYAYIWKKHYDVIFG